FYADSSIDGSGHVGKLILETGAIAGFTAEGGASNDVFTVTAGASNIELTGNAGSDLFTGTATNLSDVTDEDAIAEDLIVITDFNGSEDTLDFGFAGATATSFSNVELSNISEADTLLDALTLVGAAAVADTAA